MAVGVHVACSRALCDLCVRCNCWCTPVANVLLGCGLPFLLFTLNHGPVSVTSASCDPSLKYGLVVVGFTFVAGSMASKVRKCDWKLLGEEAKVTFGAWQAYFQLFVYFAVMVVIVARTVR